MTVSEGARLGVRVVARTLDWPRASWPHAARWLRAMGPAWIVMLADVDAPSVITAGQAGTDAGYALVLPLLAIVPILYLVQEMTARLGIATGRGQAELVRERYGGRWAAVSVAGMVGIDFLAYVGEFAGIALGAAIVGVPAPLAIGAALVVHSAVVLTRSYARFERIALILSLALFSFVVLALVRHPAPGQILAGLDPLPAQRPADYLSLAVALVGASVMPWMLFYQQAATVDKGLTVEDLPASRKETLVGAAVSQGLMAAIVIVAAGALATGAPGGAGPIASNLGPLPEGLARLVAGGQGWLVAIGLVGAGLLAAVVISLSAAWAISELLGWPHSLDLSPRQAAGFYGVYLLEVVPAAIVALASADLVRLAIGAMVLNVVALALPLGLLVRLTSDRDLLGPLANSRRRAGVLWIVAGLLLLLGIAGLGEFLGLASLG